eukprot:TRINITY_DN1226_c0_g1_i3.p1 TRINITY_DN1226_c0_g1~~TRINITY_DN1226_c0_g1_i3.p1  ORF type:complete len:588 (+),score=189.89 TRINITY_DN1226_c0_g1_i3:50-1813(+)
MVAAGGELDLLSLGQLCRLVPGGADASLDAVDSKEALRVWLQSRLQQCPRPQPEAAHADPGSATRHADAEAAESGKVTAPAPSPAPAEDAASGKAAAAAPATGPAAPAAPAKAAGSDQAAAPAATAPAAEAAAPSAAAEALGDGYAIAEGFWVRMREEAGAQLAGLTGRVTKVMDLTARAGVRLLTVTMDGGGTNTVREPHVSHDRTRLSQVLRVADVPGRGRGVLAMCDVPRGTLLMKDEAIASRTFQVRWKTDVPETPFEAFGDIARQMHSRKDLPSLHVDGKPVEADVGGRPDGVEKAEWDTLVRTAQLNSFFRPVEFEKTRVRVAEQRLYPRASFLNHSCAPNAVMHDDGYVRAVMDLRRGDEVFISYMTEQELLRPTDQRRKRLSSSHQFVCLCSRCEAPSKAELQLTACPAGSKEKQSEADFDRLLLEIEAWDAQGRPRELAAAVHQRCGAFERDCGLGVHHWRRIAARQGYVDTGSALLDDPDMTPEAAMALQKIVQGKDSGKQKKLAGKTKLRADVAAALHSLISSRNQYLPEYAYGNRDLLHDYLQLSVRQFEEGGGRLPMCKAVFGQYADLQCFDTG